MRITENSILLILTAMALALSGIGPLDRATWLLEIAPVLIGIPFLVATYRRFPLSRLAYRLLTLHALILIVGGHYTYAQVPAGFRVQEWFDLSRNHYDRLGHLAQGFVPAILAREILLRLSPLQQGKWLFFLVTCVALSISAFYEFIEWWTALAIGASAEAFLATQGDPWDTQWDMFLALLGAISSQLLLFRRHDRELSPMRSGKKS